MGVELHHIKVISADLYGKYFQIIIFLIVFTNMYLENYYVSKSYEIDHPFIQKQLFRKFKGQKCENF
jgi:hypothetical protein